MLHVGETVLIGALDRAKLVQYSTIWSASFCEAGARSGPSTFVVLEKWGKKYGSSAECTAPISNPGSVVTGGGLGSANSYSYTLTKRDAVSAVCRKPQLFRATAGL